MDATKDVRNWNDLVPINDVEVFTEGDSECLAEIGKVLSRHKMERRFGVALLHKHFDISDDEVLLERCDTAEKTLTLRPEKASALIGQDVVPTIHRFDGGHRYACSFCNKDHHTS